MHLAAMADRRRSQNYQGIVDYLTPSIWELLANGTREKACQVVLQQAWCLGMRCLTEGTYAVIQQLLKMTGGDRDRQQTSYEVYEGLSKLKKVWKTYKAARRPDDFQYHEYQSELPANPQDLPAEYYLLAFSTEERVPSSYLPNGCVNYLLVRDHEQKLVLHQITDGIGVM